MLLADRITLARLAIAPVAVAAWLLLPVEGQVCFWAAGLLCGAAEMTDWLDGKVARARKEVSDFGKLADPFCDVFYRMLVYLALLLPAGGVGFAVDAAGAAGLQQQVYLVGTTPEGLAVLGAGLMPWLPVVLMVMREVVQGALRAMCASRGLVLAARTSGKVKAWIQGAVLITAIALPAVFGGLTEWMLHAAAWGCWAAAAISVGSLIEYLWINRGVLAALIDRTP